MKLSARLVVVAAAAACAVGAAAQTSVPAGFFRLAAIVTLKGAAPDWDYLSLDSAHGHLFISRRDDGLWVYDIRTRRLLRPVANTAGSGASLVIPALGRGYSTNEDGSVTVFDLATLRTLQRIKFADDADAASYDPVSGRIALISADSRRVTFFDARTLAVTGRVELEAKKADGSVADGVGGILLNQRDRGSVVRIDAATARITAEWPITGCSQPTGIAFDAADHRAFIGCRGTKPVLAVLDTQTGTTVAALDLGRGNDGVVYDRERRRIITTNGVEANIAVFHQDDADHYRLEQAVTTRPFARTMAYDPATQSIYTVTAEGVQNPARPVNAGPSAFYPNAFYNDSFTVLTYRPTR